MFRFFLIGLLCLSANAFAQTVSGTVTDEDQNVLSAVLVFNLKTEQKTYTDVSGKFSIAANSNDELRVVRKGFERSSKIINSGDLQNSFYMVLSRQATEIEEVKIGQTTTGLLVVDIEKVGDKKSTAKLKDETAKYMRSTSTMGVLAAKPGQFVQPVSSGYSVGGINNKWDDIDFMQFLLVNIEEAFFLEELQLNSYEIQPFVYYIFRNFERKEILFSGVSSPYDLSRFINECYRKVEAYQKNLPNNQYKKERR